MIRRPPRSTQSRSSAASDVYKRQVWDGNEVWLLTAGGATFAAFPEWYATLFSGFYLPLLLILLALIVRAVAFEYRGKINSPVWRARWDLSLIHISEPTRLGMISYAVFCL